MSIEFELIKESDLFRITKRYYKYYLERRGLVSGRWKKYKGLTSVQVGDAWTEAMEMEKRLKNETR